ncbi:hypothetical protein TNCV_4564681 [Trichonephila clavipes]|nr:hypothetical protein TNCV_4564681 [Trichonephila clavipes]
MFFKPIVNDSDTVEWSIPSHVKITHIIMNLSPSCTELGWQLGFMTALEAHHLLMPNGIGTHLIRHRSSYHMLMNLTQTLKSIEGSFLGGRGSLVVKVMNSRLACHEFQPNITEDLDGYGGDAR